MKLWKNRPLFTVACAFIGVSFVGFFMTPTAKAILLCLSLSLGLIGACLKLVGKKKEVKALRRLVTVPKLWICLLITAVLSLGISICGIDRAETEANRFVGTTCEITATVTECRGRGGQMSTYSLSVTSVNGQKVSYDALLTCYYTADLKTGYEIKMTAEAISLTEAAGDIYEEYLLISDGIFGGFLSFTEQDYEILNETPSSLSGRAARLRETLSETMEHHFGEDAQGLPSALLLGERGHLRDDTKRDFSRTGVSHLLAISGLHMTLLFGMIAWFLKLFRIPPRVRAVILALGAFSYLICIGFPPSATRAVIMLGMVYLSILCHAGADPITSLGVAGMSILLFSPTTVADIGFWMSFFTSFGLLTVLPTMTVNAPDKAPRGFVKRISRRGMRALLSGLGAGVVAVTFSLWIVAASLGEMSWLSAPLTLLLTPLVGILLLLVPLALPFLGSPLASLPVAAIREVSSLITHICGVCAKPSWVTVSVRHPAILWIAVITLLVTLVLLGMSLKRKWIVILPMLTGWAVIGLILGVSHTLAMKELKVSYLTPSTAAEMLVLTRGEETVICELSNGSHRSFLTATEEASAQGATEISVFILTDYHSRTSGALFDLLRRETVRALWMPKPTDEAEYYLMLACLETAEMTKTPVTIYDYGDKLTLFGDTELTVTRTMLKRSVQPISLLMLQTPASSLTVCGSSIFESELADAAQEAILQSDTVILSGHGPNVKRPMTCDFGDKVGAVYFADKTVAAFLSPDHYPDERIQMTVGQGRFRMALAE